MANINKETTTKMRRLLSSWMVFKQKTHTFHWDLVGNGFHELHRFFKDLYTHADKNVDEIAERIRQVGEKLGMSLSQASENSAVKDENAPGDTESFMRRTLEALSALTVLQNEIFVEADQQEDYVTMDLLTELTKWTEFQSWFISSWLENAKETEDEDRD